MKKTKNSVKKEIESITFDLEIAKSNIENVHKNTIKNSNKVRKVVTKTNKIQDQFNGFVDTYNINLVKQIKDIENLKRLYKILLAGVTFIGLILIACI